jgi:hypothetical protein
MVKDVIWFIGRCLHAGASALSRNMTRCHQSVIGGDVSMRAQAPLVDMTGGII